MRRRLTDAERADRRRAAWERIVRGRPAPAGTPQGTPEDWIRAFNARFGGGAGPAVATAAGDTTEAMRYFDLRAGFTPDDLRRAFRARISRVHPDHGGSAEAARECITYYEELRA